MKRKWNRVACAFMVMAILCSFALPALAATDLTLNSFTKYAKTLQGKVSSFKDGLPEVFEGKSVIAVYYDLNSDPVVWSTKALEEEGDFWLIPDELLAKTIKEADWALLVYVSEEYEDEEWPMTVSCFVVDINKGTYYAPYEITSRDTYIGNSERTYELTGILSGMEEFILHPIWESRHGKQSQKVTEQASVQAPAKVEEEEENDSSYEQALAFVKEERFFSAYEAFMDSNSSDAYSQAQKCIKPWPKNGEVWRTSGGKGDPLEFTIVINQDADQATLLRFIRKGYPISYVFVGGNSSATVKLPAGVYTVKSGQGTDWFGIKESFGRYGRYETMTFDGGKTEIKLEAGHAYTLTINTSEKTPGTEDVGSQYESWENFSNNQ